MKRLFHKNEAVNIEGSNFDKQIRNAVKPIIESWLDLGFSRRDIENLMVSAVLLEMVFISVNKGLHKKMLKKPQKVVDKRKNS